jgi:hypothetical protein
MTTQHKMMRLFACAMGALSGALGGVTVASAFDGLWFEALRGAVFLVPALAMTIQAHRALWRMQSQPPRWGRHV